VSQAAAAAAAATTPPTIKEIDKRYHKAAIYDSNEKKRNTQNNK